MNDQTKNRIIEQYRLQAKDQRRQLRRIEQIMWWVRCGVIVTLVLALLTLGLIVGVESQRVRELDKPTTASAAEPVVLEVAEVVRLMEQMEPEESRYRPEVPLSEDLQEVLFDLCDELGLEEALVLGLIRTESGFVTDAVNPTSGCYGLCQLNPLYFPSGLTPEENLRAGLTYLAEQMERYNGDVAAALTAYNAGYDSGSRTYANKVLENRKGWEA